MAGDGVGSDKGGALLPPLPPRDIRQRAMVGFLVAVLLAGRVTSGNVVSRLPLLVALRRVLMLGGAGLRSSPRAAPLP